MSTKPWLVQARQRLVHWLVQGNVDKARDRARVLRQWRKE